MRVYVISPLARVVLLLRGRRPFLWAGVWWCYCSHRSHRRGLRCRRWFIYDGYCRHHNVTCSDGCAER